MESRLDVPSDLDARLELSNYRRSVACLVATPPAVASIGSHRTDAFVHSEGSNWSLRRMC